jgi:RNA polymerase sigma-70 factor (ECF subfamily)
MKEKADAQLVNMVREVGDTAAYGVLIRRYQGHAYGLAYSLLGDWAEAQDMAQEAFIRAYVNLHSLENPEKFPAWLQRIVFSTCMTWLRTFRSELYRSIGEPDTIEELKAIPDTNNATPMEHMLKNEMSQVVLSAISNLPQKYRIPLTMFHLNGLSYQKVADFLEIPIGTVKSLISRARKKLKPALEAYAQEVLPMVQEVLNEHKLTENFSEKVLNGVNGWPGNSKGSSVHAAQEAVMRAIGEDVSYEYLVGVSSLAFRMQVSKDLL